MSPAVEIAASAERELADARGWYRERNPRLDLELRQAFDDAVRRIVEYPRSFPEIRRGVRRATLHRFPYFVFFVTHPDRVVIVSVLHQARDPRRWPRA